MHRGLAACLFCAVCASTLPVAGEPPPSAPAQYTCDDPTCAAPVLVGTPDYAKQIASGDEFSADFTIKQPCSCTRHLSLLVAFTAQGAKNSRERTFKRDIAPGTSTTKLVMTSAELAKAKVTPGRYTVGFGLYDEHEHAAGASGAELAGHPFTFGSSKEALAAKPVVPTSIGRDAELSVPFVFSNTGDIASAVTALLVFTRPDDKQGIEYYKPNLTVKPGGAKIVVQLTAAKRRELKIGAGPWLVTASAFDGAEQRLANYPGNLLTIGKVLSQPVRPDVTTPIEHDQDLTVTLTLKNDSEFADLVTAVLVFTGAGAAKPIEYKVEGIGVPPGSTTQPIILTPTDRYNLGLRPGTWKVAATALDRAGKRLDLQRGKELVIHPETSDAPAK